MRRAQYITSKFFILVVVGMILFTALQPLLPIERKVAATEGGSWFDADSLALSTLRDNISVGDPDLWAGVRSCSQRRLTIRPERKLVLQEKVTLDQCVVETEYGIASDSYLQRSGTQIAGRVKLITGGDAAMIPVPRSADLFVLDKSAPSNTTYLGAYNDLYYDLGTETQINGSVVHKLKQPPATWLRNASGARVGVRATTLVFSQSTDYMAVDIPGVGLARINRRSMEIRPFARLPITNANWSLAVSDSGRYAVAANYEYDIFRLYDLESCPSAKLSMYQQCRHLDLRGLMKQRVADYRGAASQVSFISEDSLDFYGAHGSSGASTIAHYSLRLPGSDYGYGYLGLGDSFASGEGAYYYREGTDIADNRCHTSARSYPYLLGEQTNLGNHHSIACSGAKIDDMIAPNDGKYNKDDALAKGMAGSEYDQSIYDNFLPGYRLQSNFVSKHKPTAITVMVGGNDIGFSDIVQKCAMPGTCYEYREDREQLLRLIDDQYDRLAALYKELYEKGQKDRVRIYALGYPKVAYPEGSCAANVRLNQGELYFANELVEYLNSVIRRAAEKAGVLYVDLEDAFDGVRFCETDAYSAAINGLTAGDGVVSWAGSLGPLANESYHPSEIGHQRFAEQIALRTNDLTAPMPTPNPDLELNPNHNDLTMIQNVPSRDNDQQDLPRLQIYDNEVKTLPQGQEATLSEVGTEYGLAPGQTYIIELHSEPLQLGEAVADSNGIIRPAFQVPDTIEPGTHSIHILGENLAGEQVDLTSAVYVMGEGTSPCDQLNTLCDNSGPDNTLRTDASTPDETAPESPITNETSTDVNTTVMHEQPPEETGGSEYVLSAHEESDESIGYGEPQRTSSSWITFVSVIGMTVFTGVLAIWLVRKWGGEQGLFE